MPDSILLRPGPSGRHMPRIRTIPEDFLVEEIPLYPPTGEGPFVHLQVEKRLVNTAEVARRLARHLDVEPRRIAWAGRKDRNAVARQWVSVPATALARLDGDPESAAAGLDLGDEVRILRAVRHVDALGVGQLEGNRFELRVREVDAATASKAAERLAELVETGLPNRYGRQRFGRDGRNAERGREILAGGKVRGGRRGGRRKAWLMVTALQAEVFNEVVARREDHLDSLWSGDIAIVHATGELAWVDDVDEWEERVECFEASATGPIFGTKMRRPRGATAILESAVMEELGVPAMEKRRLPKGLQLFGDRRPLRVQPRDAEWEHEGDVLTLRFGLPAGSYATVLLDELFPGGYDEGPAAA